MKLAVLSLCAGFSTAFECQNCQSTVVGSSGVFTEVRPSPFLRACVRACLPDRPTRCAREKAAGTVFAVVVGGGAGGGNSASSTSGGSSGMVKSGLVSVPPDGSGMPVVVGTGGRGSASTHSTQEAFLFSSVESSLMQRW